MPEAQNTVPWYELARMAKEKREAKTYVNMEEGIYVLKEDWNNPNSDRRSKHDWRCMPVLSNGIRFGVRQERREDDTVDGSNYFYLETTVFPVMNPLHTAGATMLNSGLMHYLEKEPESLGSTLLLADRYDQHDFAATVLAYMRDALGGELMTNEAIRAVGKMDGEEQEALRRKHGL